MKFEKTKFSGVYIVTADVSKDVRGGFQKLYSGRIYNKNGINIDIGQVNLSKNNSKGTLRGLHYQEAPFEEEKIVKCVKGGVFDVVVDIRRDSPTFAHWISVELTEENSKLVYIPKGFAHGFITLRENTEILYIMSGNFNPDASRGIRWNDPELDIKWPTDPIVINERDQNWPLIKQL